MPSDVFRPGAGPRTDRRRFIQLLMSAALWAAPSAALRAGIARAEGRRPAPGRLGLDAEGRMQIGDEDRCPVCGMHVIRYPEFSCAIQLDDGRTFYFCDTMCLIRTWLQPEALLGVSADRLQRVVVRDYFTGRQIDGKTAFYAAGSDVTGPMGPTLIPLQQHVETFCRRHGASRVLRLEEITPAVWSQLRKR